MQGEIQRDPWSGGLAKPGVSFVNRQRGAGTRALPDFQLKHWGLMLLPFSGYEREEFTHLAVAAAIASGRADCGMGIAAAAEALDLISSRYITRIMTWLCRGNF